VHHKSTPNADKTALAGSDEAAAPDRLTAVFEFVDLEAAADVADFSNPARISILRARISARRVSFVSVTRLLL
jgi:hypothetical protein